MRKFISIIAACVGAPLLAAGIGIPSASADPTNAPGPGPTAANQPPGMGLQQDFPLYQSRVDGRDAYLTAPPPQP